jgi:hypothetical protein
VCAHRKKRPTRYAIAALAAIGVLTGCATPADAADPADLPAVVTPVATAAAQGADSDLYGQAAMEHVRQLNDNFADRLPFTAPEQAAAQWIADTLVQAGFAPDNVTLQEFNRHDVDTRRLAVFEERGFYDEADQIDISQNVVARLDGSGDGITIVATGYDSVGTTGVTYTGSGVGLLLETAANLASTTAASTDTIYFVFFGAEEIGGVGSQHFLANLPAAQRDNLRLMVNVDSLADADSLFFTANEHVGTTDEDVLGVNRSNALTDAIHTLATRLDVGLAPFKEEDFEAIGYQSCGCCVLAVPDSFIGITVVNLFAADLIPAGTDGATVDFTFDDDGADAPLGGAVDAAAQTQRTARALGAYQRFVTPLLLGHI